MAIRKDLVRQWPYRYAGVIYAVHSKMTESKINGCTINTEENL